MVCQEWKKQLDKNIFNFSLFKWIDGAVVQLGERLTGSQKVTSSTLVGSILELKLVKLGERADGIG